MTTVTIVGGGLAGAEAAWQLVRQGIPVHLFEMRPTVPTPAHTTALLAELVCSNSLRGAGLENAVGLLKEEMRQLDSLVMAAADATRVPAGGALAVDRMLFSQYITKALSTHPLAAISRREVTEIPPSPAIIATGPLTAGTFARNLQGFLGQDYLHFYDASAPIVLAESLDQRMLFRASRYGKGGDDAYLNSPLQMEEYNRFRQALLEADTRCGHLPEDAVFFEGCLPVEELAKRGPDTLRYGPLKPVGLTDPRTGKRPHAVVQLRQDDAAGSLYNLVGFQTRLLHAEQERVIRLLPGLERAEIMRWGGMHRNSYLLSPLILGATGEAREHPGLFFAGQLTGVEGYVESAAGGLVAGMNAARREHGRKMLVFPPETAIGALMQYITSANPTAFQPMNINFGLLPSSSNKGQHKRERYLAVAERSLATLKTLKNGIIRQNP